MIRNITKVLFVLSISITYLQAEFSWSSSSPISRTRSKSGSKSAWAEHYMSFSKRKWASVAGSVTMPISGFVSMSRASASNLLRLSLSASLGKSSSSRDPTLIADPNSLAKSSASARKKEPHKNRKYFSFKAEKARLEFSGTPTSQDDIWNTCWCIWGLRLLCSWITHVVMMTMILILRVMKLGRRSTEISGIWSQLMNLRQGIIWLQHKK